MKQSAKKPTNHVKHIGQIIIIMLFLLSIALSYYMGMLYQKSIDINLFNIHMQKYEELKQKEIEEAVKAAQPTATPTPSTTLRNRPTTQVTPTIRPTTE